MYMRLTNQSKIIENHLSGRNFILAKFKITGMVVLPERDWNVVSYSKLIS